MSKSVCQQTTDDVHDQFTNATMMTILHVQVDERAGQMVEKRVGAAEFKANCLRLIDELGQNDCSVVVTKRGRPVARLIPIRDEAESRSIFGSMKGTVLRYDDPFEPVGSLDDWDAAR